MDKIELNQSSFIFLDITEIYRQARHARHQFDLGIIKTRDKYIPRTTEWLHCIRSASSNFLCNGYDHN